MQTHHPTMEFMLRDQYEGKVAIGTVPPSMVPALRRLAREYYQRIPNKESSTHHMWYADMPREMRALVRNIRNNPVWRGMCDMSNRCIFGAVNEMDELYYSNPARMGIGRRRGRLFGATSNFREHRDCVFRFGGIRFYRVLVGLTDGNCSVVTRFPKLNISHRINRNDYVVFDFDRSTHEVFKTKSVAKPRMLLKLHFIVCEECTSPAYVRAVKRLYICYEGITRYIMHTGTDPETYYEFFCGVMCEWGLHPRFPYIVFCLVLVLSVLTTALFTRPNKAGKADGGGGAWLAAKVGACVVVQLIVLYLLVVFYYWAEHHVLRLTNATRDLGKSTWVKALG